VANLTEDKINVFLSISRGDDSGDGSGSGSGEGWSNGDGWGWGSGSGSGAGYGWSNGSGSGSGSGDGWGSGDGSGSGSGSGWGSGDGSGSGSGEGLAAVNGERVYIVDRIPTIFRAIRGNTARGAILRDDLTLAPCYVAKLGNYFAHGDTLKAAVAAVQEKYFDDLPVEDKINTLLEEIDVGKKYPASFWYDWHHKLTGSCKMGRDEFMRSHDIAMDDKYTVREFIDITRDAYGSSVIAALEEMLGKS